MNKIATLALSAAAFLGAFAAPAAHAAFTPEKRINTQAGPSIQPNIAVAGNNVYIVWVENPPTGTAGDIWFARSHDYGETFATTQLTSGARNDITPIIAAGGSQVHVFWTDSSTNGTAFHRGSNNWGQSWGAEKSLSPADSFYSRPGGAVVDSDGRVHFAYYDNRIDGTYGQIYYRCSADQGASFSADVNLNLYDGQVDHELPRMTQAADGTLYLLMRTNKFGFPQGGLGPTDQFLMRTNGAVTSCSPSWLRPAQRITIGLPEEFNTTYGAQIAAGSSDTLHAAWWGNKSGTNLFYRRGFPNGKGWETPIELSGFGASHPEWDGNTAEHSSFGIGDDGQGRVHAVFGSNTGVTEGFPTGQLWYACSANGGGTFAAKQMLTAGVQTAQARGVAAEGIFHMVWMDWRNNNQGAEIYYRKAINGCGGTGAVPTMDLNGDGRSDILYRNNSNGQVYRLFANGISLSGGQLVYTEGNLAWKIVGDGDFNGDGIVDIVWHNLTTNQVYLQTYNSSGVPSGGGMIYQSTSSQWRIVATPDINGDGKADLLWRNQTTGQVWVVLMDGLSIIAEGLAYTEPSAAWQIVGVGDTDADGKTNQVIWRNTSTGQVYLLSIFHGGGSNFATAGFSIYNEPNTAWTIKAVADFTGDGKSDLLYRNGSTGQVYVMPLDGTTVLPGAVVHVEPSASWVIVANGDYNGDGKADILWRNSSTGQVYMMLVNGLSISQQGMVYTEGNTAWRVMGPVEYAQ